MDAAARAGAGQEVPGLSPDDLDLVAGPAHDRGPDDGRPGAGPAHPRTATKAGRDGSFTTEFEIPPGPTGDFFLDATCGGVAKEVKLRRVP